MGQLAGGLGLGLALGGEGPLIVKGREGLVGWVKACP